MINKRSTKTMLMMGITMLILIACSTTRQYGHKVRVDRDSSHRPHSRHLHLSQSLHHLRHNLLRHLHLLDLIRMISPKAITR